MMVTIALLFIVLWLVGVFTAYTFGGYINILLIAAAVMLVMRIRRG